MLDALEVIFDRDQEYVQGAVAFWQKMFAKEIKPVLWRFHESVIPKNYNAYGILSQIKKQSDLSGADRERMVVADAWDLLMM